MCFGRISAVTLGPLHCDKPEEFTDLKYAISTWHDHSHWLDGAGFRVTCPWIVMVIERCMTPGGNVNKRIGGVIKRLGGYWEVTRNGTDIQGVLSWPQRLESKAGVVAGHAVYLCGEGVTGMTGRKVPVCDGDPLSTDQDAFSVMLSEMGTKPPVDVRARPMPNTRNTTSDGRRPTVKQLSLFENQ
jgi:hypothetical protein